MLITGVPPFIAARRLVGREGGTAASTTPSTTSSTSTSSSLHGVNTTPAGARSIGRLSTAVKHSRREPDSTGSRSATRRLTLEGHVVAHATRTAFGAKVDGELAGLRSALGDGDSTDGLRSRSGIARVRGNSPDSCPELETLKFPRLRTANTYTTDGSQVHPWRVADTGA
jgi:hypothetical protein